MPSFLVFHFFNLPPDKLKILLLRSSRIKSCLALLIPLVVYCTLEVLIIPVSTDITGFMDHICLTSHYTCLRNRTKRYYNCPYFPQDIANQCYRFVCRFENFVLANFSVLIVGFCGASRQFMSENHFKQPMKKKNISAVPDRSSFQKKNHE